MRIARSLAVAACLLVLALPVSVAASSIQVTDVSGVVARVLPEVVTIVVLGSDGKLVGVASGVAVSHTAVLTNHHVIAAGPKAAVVVQGLGEPMSVTGVLADDKADDLELVSVSGWLPHVATIGNSNDLRVGQAVVAIGAPEGLADTVSTGVVSAFRMLTASTPCIQVSAPLSPGDSGGGLFDAKGHLVGVTVAGLKVGQDLNFALPVALARPMLAALQPAKPAPAAPVTSFKDVPPSMLHSRNPSIAFLAFEGIMGGYPDGTFRPEKPISRAELAAVLGRATGLTGTITPADARAPNFTDGRSIPRWAWPSVDALVRAGILSGYPDGTFRPSNPVTEAQAVTMLVRALHDQPWVQGTDWPDNYIRIATWVNLVGPIAGIRVDPSALATRRWIADIVYNAAAGVADWTMTVDGKPQLQTEGGIFTLNTHLGRLPMYAQGTIAAVSRSRIVFYRTSLNVLSVYQFAPHLFGLCDRPFNPTSLQAGVEDSGFVVGANGQLNAGC